MHYKWLERRFLVSLRCLGVMRAAQPSQVIKDNQWKMWGSVVLRIPNPTYNRNSTRNYYLNLTLFQSDWQGTGLAIICLLVLLCSQKTRTATNQFQEDRYWPAHAWNSELAFVFYFLWQISISKVCLQVYQMTASSPKVGLIYHRIFIGTNNSLNK